MRTRKTLKAAAIGLALFLTASISNAVPIQWTLSGVTFNDGNTASGSFIFDATASTFSSLLISTTSGFTYATKELSAVPFGVNASGIELVDGFVAGDNVGKSIMNLDFLSALTDAGGVIGLLTGFPSFEGQCIAADCSSGRVFRTVTSGSVVGVAIPEPSVLVLLMLGLGGLVVTRRRVKQQ